MVMFVNYKDIGVPSREMHVGDMQIPNAINVCFIQADGHELAYIRDMFTDIPFTNNRTVKWTGEFAKFIAMNLK